MANSDMITFGWELELLVHLQKNESDSHPLQAAKLRELALSLKERAPDLPIAAECAHYPSQNCCICEDAPPEVLSRGLRVFTPAMPLFTPESNSENLYFHVKREMLEVPTNEYGKTLAQGFEITSPILDNEELKSGLPKTAQIVSAIRNCDLSISAHDKCGLHIHVGVKSGMTLTIAKKAATLVMLLEQPLFTAFSPTARSEDSTWFKYIGKYSCFAFDADDTVRECHSITKDNTTAQLLKHVPIPPSQMKPAAWNHHNANRWYLTLDYIWEKENTWELYTGLLTEVGGKTSLAICTRTTDGKSAGEMDSRGRDGTDKLEGSQTTIEFRYPPMSFDHEFIKNWVEISCRIVVIATHDAPFFSQVAAGLLSELQRDEKQSDLPTWARLLTVLGLDHQIDFWTQQLRRFGAGETIRFLDSKGLVLPDC
ncbi:uncharacterized protein Triagg1_151 [Trichoderma aggressivum f. europaeum]|uniref:Amidoligase enzyme n=1 Tax=Trichoderma aggressivum f. europaeum TaxID=173218 RepID=A0AAE1IJV7_9HYPO|nr:hypothetical protein Triagg1_151 [Trichoderma aggressivum f. europaeum]